MSFIFLPQNSSILVLNHIYKLQLQQRSPEEVLFLALPTSLPKYTSQLFPILPPGGNLVAFLLRSLQPYAILLYQFRRYFRLPERPIKGGKVTGSITYFLCRMHFKAVDSFHLKIL